MAFTLHVIAFGQGVFWSFPSKRMPVRLGALMYTALSTLILYYLAPTRILTGEVRQRTQLSTSTKRKRSEKEIEECSYRRHFRSSPSHAYMSHSSQLISYSNQVSWLPYQPTFDRHILSQNSPGVPSFTCSKNYNARAHNTMFEYYSFSVSRFTVQA